MPRITDDQRSILALEVDPTIITDVAARVAVNTLAIYNGNLYRYMRAEDAAWVAGHALQYTDVVGEATNDRAGGSAKGTMCAGIAVAAVPDGYYGWVLVKGYTATILGDGSVAAGDHIMIHASTDGACDTLLAATTTTDVVAACNAQSKVFGVALTADDSSNNFTAMVDCL